VVNLHRFFLTQDCLTGDSVSIPDGLVHRLRRVLRLGAGDHIVVLDNSGWEYEVELREASRDGLEGSVLGRSWTAGEPRASITLYQALLKGQSMELVLQKCTEIGVASFVPMICERCVAGEPTSARLSRWTSIVQETAQQSRRGKLPSLSDAVPFPAACAVASGVGLMPWEGEADRCVGDVLGEAQMSDDAPQVSIFVGPEGGFSAEEVEQARQLGIASVSLGRRILRAETAGLVAATAVLYELGDLGSGRP
jgi:16S rRNA (uracil1498-N3)-methyltransferase